MKLTQESADVNESPRFTARVGYNSEDVGGAMLHREFVGVFKYN
jgi:hypothetical protein